MSASELTASERRRELTAEAARKRAVWDAAPADRRPDAEAQYVAVIGELCELLIQQDPPALAELAAAAVVEVNAPAHRNLLRYYAGLGAGLAERYAEADQILAELLAEPALDDAVRGRALNSAAIFAQLCGDYERALSGFRAGAALWLRIGNRARYGLALYNIGILCYDLHDYAGAAEQFAAAAACFEALNDTHRLAMTWHELALLYRDQGRWDEAIDYARRAEAQFARDGLDDYLGRVANNLAEIALLRGRLDEAAAELDRAEALMSTRVYRVDVALNRGLLLQARGDDHGAAAAYSAARTLAEAIERHDIVPALYGRLAHAARRSGDPAMALVHEQAALTAVEARREPLRDEGLLIGLMGRWQGLYETAVAAAAERGDAQAALEIGERARARAFADLLARGGAGRSAPPTPAAPLDLAAIQAALPPHTLVLAYFAAGLDGPESALLNAMPPEAAPVRACLAVPPRLLLTAVSRETLRVHVCSLDPNLLNAASPFLADGRRFLRPAILRRAYDALIAPVADLIATTEHLIVVPHGPLHQVPFAALRDAADRPLLDQAQRLSYAPSVSVLLGNPAPPPAADRRSCLALGYAGSAEQPLRHTVAEAASVAARCDGVFHDGATVQLDWLLAEAQRYRWLHLACHGEFRLAEPLASWLEPAPGERLTAAMVIDRLALDADLVTLSACRSGVSAIRRGDEPLGLVRAFLLAGARALLVTLWPVEDHSAQLLMERFYTVLRTQPGDDAPAALRAAQFWLRTWQAPDGTTPYADPAFWAPFVLIGRAGAPYLTPALPRRA